MNSTEFNKWISFHRDTFSDIDAWLGGMTADKQRKLFGHWLEALADVALGDALAASKAMLRGDLDAPRAYERDTTPAAIRRYAKGLSRDRAPKSESERYLEPRKRQRPVGVGGQLMDQVAKLINQGMTAREAAAQIVPAANEDEYDSPRWSCSLCQDTAWVDCWHDNAVVAASRGEVVTDIHANRMCVACTCQKAQRLANYESRRRFDPAKCCRIKTGDVDELRVWIQERINAKRTTCFDEWNRRTA